MHEVVLNINKSKQVGEILKAYKVRKSFLDRPFLSLDSDRETRLRVYFLSAAICHQTRSLHNPLLNLWGWEYMEHAFVEMVKNHNPLLNPASGSILSEDDITHLLKKAFSADGNPENTTLDRIEERVSMWREICSLIKSDFQGSVSKFLDQSKGLLLDKGNGLYERLSELQAFCDPQHKKITFFLKLAQDAGVLHIKDPENIIPIMDYHMQRVLLRLGCVEVKDENLRDALVIQKRLNSDEPIRGKCIEALKIIAESSNHGILKLNDFFWPLGRSCCKETTLCTDDICVKNPCTLYEMIEMDDHPRCIFQDVCSGAKDEDFKKLWEPMVETNYY